MIVAIRANLCLCWGRKFVVTQRRHSELSRAPCHFFCLRIRMELLEIGCPEIAWNHFQFDFWSNFSRKLFLVEKFPQETFLETSPRKPSPRHFQWSVSRNWIPVVPPVEAVDVPAAFCRKEINKKKSNLFGVLQACLFTKQAFSDITVQILSGQVQYCSILFGSSRRNPVGSSYRNPVTGWSSLPRMPPFAKSTSLEIVECSPLVF